MEDREYSKSRLVCVWGEKVEERSMCKSRLSVRLRREGGGL